MKAPKKPSTELMEKVWTLIEHGTGVKVYSVLCIIAQAIPYNIHGPGNHNNMELACNPVTTQKQLIILCPYISQVLYIKAGYTQIA